MEHRVGEVHFACHIEFIDTGGASSPNEDDTASLHGEVTREGECACEYAVAFSSSHHSSVSHCYRSRFATSLDRAALVGFDKSGGGGGRVVEAEDSLVHIHVG